MADKKCYGNEPQNTFYTEQRSKWIATEGQTLFGGINYLVGYIDVYINGIKLTVTDDFTASTGTNFTLTTGAKAGDVVESISKVPSSIKDTYTQAQVNSLLAASSIPVAYATNTADVFTATFTGQVAGYSDPQLVAIVVPNASTNTTTTPQFNPNSLGNKPILNYDGTNVAIGQMKGTVLLRHNGTTNSWYISNGSGITNTSRGTLSITSTPDFISYASFTMSMTGNATLTAPASTSLVPTTGTWYCDVTVDSTGGYTLTFTNSGSVLWNKVYGYTFDCLPNAIYRLWMTSRGSSTIDVNIERLV